MIDKHNVDAALRYKGKIAGTTVAGAVGYCHTRGTQSAGSSTCFTTSSSTVAAISQLNGSISFLTPIGIGGAFSGGTQWRDRVGTGHSTKADPYNLSPSIFYTTKLTELGSTTFEYSYQYAKHITNKGDKGWGHEVVAMQKIDSIGGDYYLRFIYVDAETATNTNIEPLWYFGGGFRQRF